VNHHLFLLDVWWRLMLVAGQETKQPTTPATTKMSTIVFITSWSLTSLFSLISIFGLLVQLTSGINRSRHFHIIFARKALKYFRAKDDALAAYRNALSMAF
jgi:cytochrome b561